MLAVEQDPRGDAMFRRLPGLAAALAFAGGACAETPAPLSPYAAAMAQDAVRIGPLQSVVSAADLRSPVQGPYARDDAAGAGVLARTAIDHRFSRNGLVGSVGYLCGIETFAPGVDENRGAEAGYGRQSTFLGARISLPFR